MNLPTLQDGELNAQINYAKALAQSDLLPREFRGKPANVLVAIGYGEALGLSPMIALNGISVINGKPSLSAQLQSALVRRAGHKLNVVGDATKATAVLIRHDDPTERHTATWTMDRAKRAGLDQGTAWKSYPESMLAARAITEVIRNAASDVLLGVAYTPEELGNIDDVPAVVSWVEYGDDDENADA
jgi:hypothetical protein